MYAQYFRMSLFANQLKTSMEAHRISQTTVSRIGGLSQSVTSRYINGGHRPRPNKLEKILPAFSMKQRLLIALAYLDDDVPASMRDLIKVEPQDREGLTRAPTFDYSRMPRDVRVAYEGLGSAALADRKVGKHLISLHRLLPVERTASSPRRPRDRPRGP